MIINQSEFVYVNDISYPLTTSYTSTCTIIASLWRLFITSYVIKKRDIKFTFRSIFDEPLRNISVALNLILCIYILISLMFMKNKLGILNKCNFFPFKINEVSTTNIIFILIILAHVFLCIFSMDDPENQTINILIIICCITQFIIYILFYNGAHIVKYNPSTNTIYFNGSQAAENGDLSCNIYSTLVKYNLNTKNLDIKTYSGAIFLYGTVYRDNSQLLNTISNRTARNLCFENVKITKMNIEHNLEEIIDNLIEIYEPIMKNHTKDKYQELKSLNITTNKAGKIFDNMMISSYLTNLHPLKYKGKSRLNEIFAALNVSSYNELCQLQKERKLNNIYEWILGDFPSFYDWTLNLKKCIQNKTITFDHIKLLEINILCTLCDYLSYNDESSISKETLIKINEIIHQIHTLVSFDVDTSNINVIVV